MATTDTLDQAQKEGRAPWSKIVYALKDCVWYEDAYPVTEGHALIVPREANQQNIAKCFELALKIGNENIQKGLIDGYNIGINVGAAAGQTCMYPHVHLIPRRQGDMEDPTGGVRHVIPHKGNYKK
jgi:diadenosine tetraphosphate (Ap4A) HIT family hydrolase